MIERFVKQINMEHFVVALFEIKAQGLGCVRSYKVRKMRRFVLGYMVAEGQPVGAT